MLADRRSLPVLNKKNSSGKFFRSFARQCPAFILPRNISSDMTTIRSQSTSLFWLLESGRMPFGKTAPRCLMVIAESLLMLMMKAKGT
jgi:hypothetical protein